jgi:hypothetical protein
MLSPVVYAFASAVGRYSPACGHWREEFQDGQCFECIVKRIERENWRRIGQVITNAVRAHPELLRLHEKREANG